MKSNLSTAALRLAREKSSTLNPATTRSRVSRIVANTPREDGLLKEKENFNNPVSTQREIKKDYINRSNLYFEEPHEKIKSLERENRILRTQNNILLAAQEKLKDNITSKFASLCDRITAHEEGVIRRATRLIVRANTIVDTAKKAIDMSSVHKAKLKAKTRKLEMERTIINSQLETTLTNRNQSWKELEAENSELKNELNDAYTKIDELNDKLSRKPISNV